MALKTMVYITVEGNNTLQDRMMKKLNDLF
jgi:hypothetical protein